VDIVLNVRSKADNSIKESNFPVNGSIFVGRGPDCVVLLDGQGISREHLAVAAEGSAIFVTDMSSNGTWLNGKRLAQNGRSKIEQGDLIEVPGYELRLQIPGAPEPPSPPVLQQQEQQENSPGAAAPASLLGSFALLDKFVVFVALVSLGLLLVYMTL
jgi:pSer/pThr/pTyr-binding forkhead associated (FHA) protein